MTERETQSSKHPVRRAFEVCGYVLLLIFTVLLVLSWIGFSFSTSTINVFLLCASLFCLHRGGLHSKSAKRIYLNLSLCAFIALFFVFSALVQGRNYNKGSDFYRAEEY
jgi:hypothetical protein